MTRVPLRVYQNPGGAELFVRLTTHKGDYEWIAATIDTGAEVTLLPLHLMAIVPYQITARGQILVEQAGIAQQSFEVTEARVTLALEGLDGTQTGEFQAVVWFTDTQEALLGFDGILDRAILHLDMPALTGYIDLADHN